VDSRVDHEYVHSDAAAAGTAVCRRGVRGATRPPGNRMASCA